MTSTEKLVAALKKAGAPSDMIIYAESGGYNDYKSQSATPCVDLVNALAKHGLFGLQKRALSGEFDATKEESEAWAKEMQNDPQMGPLLKQMGLGPKE